MLLSAVIHLKALERGALPQYLGPALRAEFLNWIGETDIKVSNELHDGNTLRPYTVSDLKGTFHAQRGFNLVEAGQTAWFRVTSLHENQTRLLVDNVFPKMEGESISLNRVKFKVVKVAEAGHPWARQATYESLVEKYFKTYLSPSDSLEMEFASPTTFSSDGLHVPLPIPKTVLKSWLNRWNKYSSASLPRAVKELKDARLALSFYALSTSPLHYKDTKNNSDITWIGFMGRCRFRVLAKDEFWLRLCHLLADYSFYCGTGKKTSFGMGQTRRT